MKSFNQEDLLLKRKHFRGPYVENKIGLYKYKRNGKKVV